MPVPLNSRLRRCVRASVLLSSLCALGLGQDVLTFHNDAARSGVQSHETVLTPANVNSAQFGKVATFAVDGDVYAQPLYVGSYTMSDGQAHNVLLVATVHDWVYAFDADGNNGTQGYLWRTSLLGSGETWVSSNDVGTGDITPDIGVVGTPVIDRTGGTVYVVAKSKTTTGTTVFRQRLHALTLASGTEKLNGPTLIAASLAGTGDGGTTVSFDPFRNNQRPALLLAATPGGTSASSVLIAWASHGDNTPYHGWVISYNAANVAQQTGAWVDTPNGVQGGIWMSAGGLSTDGTGAIFGASGNGTFDGSDYADSLFKLTASGSGLTLSDYFTPNTQSSLNGGDQDFGVGGAPLVVPDQTGPVAHLILTADKSGQIYLLNRDNLGKYGSTNSDVQDFSDGGYSVHSNLVFFNNMLYLTPDGGPVEAWTFNPATGKFTTTTQAKSAHVFGCNGCDGAGSNFSISANGTANGVLWAIDYSGYGNGAAVLYAYGTGNVATELYDSSQAANSRDAAAIAVKFTAPTVANGKVFVGGRNAVTVYGLLGVVLPVAATPTFSPAGGNYSNAQSVTITDATAGAKIYYTLDGSTPTTASALYSSPIAVSGTTTLKAVATAGGYQQSAVGSALYTIGSGSGTVADGGGFAGASLALNGSAKVNGTRVRLTDGNGNEAGSVFYPSPLSVTGFVTDFSFQLTNPNADGIAFVIQNTGSTALGATGGALGYAGIGKSVAVKFDLYNNAGEGVDSTGLYTNGASPFTPATDLTASGVNLHSGDVFKVHASYNGATLTVTITDATTGKSQTQSYPVNIPSLVGGNSAYAGFTGGTGGLTATQEIVSWTYTPTAVPSYPNGFTGATGLTFNGGAAISGSNLRLTDGGGSEARSVFYSNPVNVQSFTTSFRFQLTNPNADGFAFVVQGTGPTALGPLGGGLGYGPDQPNGTAIGIGKSIAVKFDLYNNAGEGTNSTGLYTNGASPTTPATDLTSSGINLHSGDVFAVTATYSGTTLTVAITDTATKAASTQTYTVNIPTLVGGPNGYVGFTAGTGGLTATQDVQTWSYQN